MKQLHFVQHMANLVVFQKYLNSKMGSYQLYLHSLPELDRNMIDTELDILTDQLAEELYQYSDLLKPQPITKLYNFTQEIPEYKKYGKIEKSTVAKYIDVIGGNLAVDFFKVLQEFEKQPKQEVKSTEDILTKTEVAKMLSVTESTIDSYIRQGKLIAYGVAGKRYFKRKEIIDNLQKTR